MRPSISPRSKAPALLFAFLEKLLAWFGFLAELLSTNGRRRVRARRPWQVRIRGKQNVRLRGEDVERLLQRQKDLKDLDRIANYFGVGL